MTNFREVAEAAVRKLESDRSDLLVINSDLNRQLVSFQANKAEPVNRWFAYREGFSKSLVEYIFEVSAIKPGSTVGDPFAGTGASAIAAAEKGSNGIAFELLPVGIEIMETWNSIQEADRGELVHAIETAVATKPWQQHNKRVDFENLRITENAFPATNDEALGRYRSWARSTDEDQARIFSFAAFCILESISYTRKDGQYLRWDSLSNHGRSKSTFSKGPILDFDFAIVKKLEQIAADLRENLADDESARSPLTIFSGSVLESMPLLEPESIDLVVTSPPYCNRYDYTRTYALELAYLGVDEKEIRRLRQALLTCTVEHKERDFREFSAGPLKIALNAHGSSNTLSRIVQFLRSEAADGRLNNRGIVNMVDGYFLDLSLHLVQTFTKLKPGSSYFMVNDNVQYNGVSIPVDLILCEIAESIGFKTEFVWVLPRGKGNSSQQMKIHGRRELRKCVYHWRVPLNRSQEI